VSAGPRLSVQGVSVAFGGVRALDRVDLEASPGEIAGLIGPNGAGKTTLLAAISGFLTPDAGRVVYGDRDLAGGPPQRAVAAGVVRTFQATRPVASLTVVENVMVGAHRTGGSGALGALLATARARRDERAMLERAGDLLDRVGLAGHRDALPGELAAGQLRLLEIARVLAAEPTLVLLDEPAAGLNHEETRRLEDTLVALNGGGLTCLLVEHDVELVLRICHRVTVLDHGRVIAAGRPDAIRSDPAVIEAYLGTHGEPREATHA
jgi:branched-chain amino acid transport system ATP-binding protein